MNDVKHQLSCLGLWREPLFFTVTLLKQNFKQCSNARLLTNYLRGQLSEVNHNNFVSTPHPTS